MAGEGLQDIADLHDEGISGNGNTYNLESLQK